MPIARILALLSAAIFLGEIAVMYVLDQLPISNTAVRNFLDAAMLLAIVFPVLYFFSLRTMLLTQTRLEKGIKKRTAEIEEAKSALEHSVGKLQRQRQEILLLGEMGNFFQSCQNIEEAMVVAEVQLRRLFPDMSGALYLLNSSRNILEKKAIWGDSDGIIDRFAPGDCWALRRSKPHIVSEAERPLSCRHAHGSEAPWQICLPLVAQGEAIGALYLATKHSQSRSARSAVQIDEERLKFFGAAGENLALAVANLRLQEMLRYQALRDPLTGLYNRRYLLDTMERELDRAASRDNALSLVMFDIDHFKKFNDTFGHAAGDTVLARLGGALREWAESEDILVRFGGEEFTIVLPDTPAELAFERIEALRRMVESLAIDHEGSPVGRVTISAGIASYPLHGKDREALTEKADQALYRSKKSGRNRTTVAEDSLEKALPPASRAA